LDAETDDLQFIRCAIYTRQSVLRRGDPALASCKVQRLLCTEFIRSMAWRGWYPVGEHFDDEGFSGATVERPGLEKLFQRIREGDVKRVIVYRLDRLTRRLSDWALLVRVLQRFNVGLTVVHGAIDAEAGSLARLQMNMLATFAELERDLISERLADARAARKARGQRSAGRVPLGYATNPRSKQLVIAEEEAKTVRWFFEKAAAGMPPAELAVTANKIGLSTKLPSTAAWSPRSVLRLLRNKVYTGLRPDGSPGSHPPIVTATQFERAQKALAARRSRAPSKRAQFDPRQDPFILRGLVRCAACKKVMTTSMSTRLTKRTARNAPRYYRCRTAGCGGQVAAAELEALAFDLLRRAASDSPDSHREALTAAVSVWENLWPVNRRRELDAAFETMTCNTRSGELSVALRAESDDPSGTAVAGMPGDG
jgi:DNA invertase Pin-like site-specific DNA recombinase